MKKSLVVAAVAAGVCLLGSACGVSTKSGGPAPTNELTGPGGSVASSSSEVKKPTMPVSLSGSGEEVKTANLEPGGYTVKYTNTSGYMIVAPVSMDGTTGASLINASETSGVVTYSSTGPVTLQITNTQGPWTLNFVPLG